MRLYCHAFTGYQLATLEFAEKRPWVSKKLPDNWDDTLRRLAGPPDQSVFDYVRVSNALPEPLRITPRRFGEIGLFWDGKIINSDTESYLERLCLMQENGVLDWLTKRQHDNGTINIVEIGGGYGGLAYFLSLIFGENLQYSIIDIPSPSHSRRFIYLFYFQRPVTGFVLKPPGSADSQPQFLPTCPIRYALYGSTKLQQLIW